MDTNILAATIGGGATIVAAVITIRASRRRSASESQNSIGHGVTERPDAKKVPQTHIVDPVGRDHATISEAILAAAPRDKILVRPGVYREGIVLDKPLEIIGDGDSEDIVVHSDGQSALWFRATAGHVSNLTLRQVNSEAQQFAVTIAQGRLTLTQCDISNQSLSSVGIFGGADPILRNNRIHDSKQSGVFIYNNGLGVLEDNNIFANASHGVGVSQGGDPTCRKNSIHDNESSGVYVWDDGKGTFEENDIFANSDGVLVLERGNPTMRKNRIHNNEDDGVCVYDDGKGTFEENDIRNNKFGGRVLQGGNPTMRKNRIHENKKLGLGVGNGGKGTFEENFVHENGFWRGPRFIVEDSAKPNVTLARNKNQHGLPIDGTY